MPSSCAAKAAAARTSGSDVLIVEPAMQFLKPSADATSQLGAAAPWPQPPEPLVWATSGPAHLPDVKPQQALGVGCARGENDLLARLGRGRRRRRGRSSSGRRGRRRRVVCGRRGKLDAVEVGGERSRRLDSGVRKVAVHGAGDAVGEAEGLRDVAVGRGGAEAAATVTGLCD
jgi:hypothetical protein